MAVSGHIFLYEIENTRIFNQVLFRLPINTRAVIYNCVLFHDTKKHAPIECIYIERCIIIICTQSYEILLHNSPECYFGVMACSP